jgi:hypothetical protein
MAFSWILPSSSYLDGGNYRPLKERTPRQQGWDVFAVQTGLLAAGEKLPVYGPDGIYGKESGDAVESFQKRRGLKVDRIAGGDTMREIGNVLADKVTAAYGFPQGLAKGQFEKESSKLPPNYSAVRSDTTRDEGLVQLNTKFNPDSTAFDTRVAYIKYAERVKSYYTKYRSWGVAERRAWELAAGSWNAPDWTDRLAQGKTLTATQQAHIDAYIEAATALVVW